MLLMYANRRKAMNRIGARQNFEETLRGVYMKKILRNTGRMVEKRKKERRKEERRSGAIFRTVASDCSTEI